MPRSPTAALAAGAVLVNDVSGGLADPRHGAEWWPTPGYRTSPCTGAGPSADMEELAVYDDVVADVARGARRAGRRRGGRRGRPGRGSCSIPGLGFAKTAEHNWALLRALPALHALGHPLLIGAPARPFLGRLLADERSNTFFFFLYLVEYICYHLIHFCSMH